VDSDYHSFCYLVDCLEIRVYRIEVLVKFVFYIYIKIILFIFSSIFLYINIST